MSTVILRNGVIDEGSLPVRSRAVLHGYGAFEVLRAYGGRAFRFEEHCTRLHRSLSVLGLQLGCSVGELAGEVSSAIAACGSRDAHVRVVVSLGEGPDGLSLDRAMRSDRWVIARAMKSVSSGEISHATTVSTETVGRSGLAAELAQLKTNNYALPVMALRRAQARGFDDALLCDGTHYWEATAANLFCVHENTLSTPPTSGPILPGITRAAVLELAQAEGIRTIERPINAADLWTADEVFLTSTIRELRAVSMIDEHEVGDGTPGRVTRVLHRAFRQLVESS